MDAERQTLIQALSIYLKLLELYPEKALKIKDREQLRAIALDEALSLRKEVEAYYGK